ncbi:acyl carrier protein [Streptomyces sp. NPDC017988]|jgi:acyl carrier protein|uniref:acyl carrier protein n=1 Tax=Streptomyces sp. NPDC017988 TaxID=3365025 RepID=UPI00379E2D60
MSSTYDRLVGLLAKGFGVEEGEVAPEDTFEELELDSLALVELTLAAQEEFGISLTDDDLHAKNTLSEAAHVLDAKQVAVR